MRPGHHQANEQCDRAIGHAVVQAEPGVAWVQGAHLETPGQYLHGGVRRPPVPPQMDAEPQHAATSPVPSVEAEALLDRGFALAAVPVLRTAAEASHGCTST